MRTDELEDFAGILDRLVAVDGTEVLKRGAFGVTVGVSWRNVETVQDAPLLYQIVGDGDGRGELAQETGDHMPPRFLVKMKVESLHRLLRSLVGSETGPFVPSGAAGILRLFQVPLCLPKPVSRPLRHDYAPSRTMRTRRLGSSPTEYEERPASRAISCWRRRMKAFWAESSTSSA